MQSPVVWFGSPRPRMTSFESSSARLFLLICVGGLACRDASVLPTTPVPHIYLTDSRANADAGSAPLVVHIVAPQATDPAIDQFLDNHYASLDTSARSNHRLLVLMTGTGQLPAQFRFLQNEAARLGYHAIGLEFVNSGGIAKICPPTPDPNACFENVRLEVIDGVDRTPLISVSPANGIENRLDKLLRYLAAQFPGEDWSQFITPNGPKWPLIAVAGLSVGGGEAAMIAKGRLVDRVVMFSSVPDSIGKGSVAWVAQHETPSNRYYGLAHNRDGFFLPILASWDSLGLTAFGPAVVVDGAQAPYGNSHMLVTGLTPVGGFVGLNAHASTATDAFTPLAADGTPLLLAAWRYLLSAGPRSNEPDF
jgi:hypothetical protein